VPELGLAELSCCLGFDRTVRVPLGVSGTLTGSGSAPDGYRTGSGPADFNCTGPYLILYPNDVGIESSPRPGRTAARLARQVELALAEVDLSLPQYRILIHLDEGKIAASALADKLAVSRPSITAVVDGLVTRGLVERHHDPGDRRRVGHDLTPKGRNVLEDADESVDRRLAEIASTVDETRIHQLQEVRDLEYWRLSLDAYRTVKREVAGGPHSAVASDNSANASANAAVAAADIAVAATDSAATVGTPAQ
jgi:long-chain acyl-CoA synthetase